jgi:hypothetical protein
MPSVVLTLGQHPVNNEKHLSVVGVGAPWFKHPSARLVALKIADHVIKITMAFLRIF